MKNLFYGLMAAAGLVFCAGAAKASDCCNAAVRLEVVEPKVQLRLNVASLDTGHCYDDVVDVQRVRVQRVEVRNVVPVVQVQKVVVRQQQVVQQRQVVVERQKVVERQRVEKVVVKEKQRQRRGLFGR